MLIPKDNEKDLAEIPDNVKEGLKIIPVAEVSEVLKHALTKPLVPLNWSEEELAKELAGASAQRKVEDGVTTH